jgi:hypothetical protein
MKLKRLLLTPVLLLVVVYAGDYLSLRFQIPNNRQQYGSVMVRRSYAVPLKNRQTEYLFDPPAPQDCVYSLFPHFGDSPCWYLDRHVRQQVNVGGAPPAP